MSLVKQNVMLLIIVVAMIIMPLMMQPNAEFSGADDQLRVAGLAGCDRLSAVVEAIAGNRHLQK